MNSIRWLGLLSRVVAWGDAPPGEEAAACYRELEGYVETLLTQARAEAAKDALVTASDCFDGERAYNFILADGYSNGRNIAGELYFMSTQVDAARQLGAKP